MKYKTLFDGLARPFVLILFTLGVLAMSIMQIPITEFVRDAYMVVLVFFFTARTAEKAMEQHRQREPNIFRATEKEEAQKRANLAYAARLSPSTAHPAVDRSPSRQAGGLR